MSRPAALAYRDSQGLRLRAQEVLRLQPRRAPTTMASHLSSKSGSGGTVLRFNVESRIHILDAEQRRSPDPHRARACGGQPEGRRLDIVGQIHNSDYIVVPARIVKRLHISPECLYGRLYIGPPA